MYIQTKRNFSHQFRCHKDNLASFLSGNFPDFVYRRLECLPKGVIPVFVFHDVQPEDFEIQMKYLAKNGYTPLSAEDFYKTISGNIKCVEKAVVLTFDDGHRSLWSTAYPILKKYSFRAISFIAPYTISEKPGTTDNITSLCSWEEIKEMSSSGVVDFQSHTCWHHSVFICDKLVDFADPGLTTSFLKGDLHPLIRRNGNDSVIQNLEWGQPIYKWAPAMSTEKRFIENETLSDKCIDYVKSQGGMNFFKKKGWRRKLFHHFRAHSKQSGKSGCYQTPEDRYDEIRQDLSKSKNKIGKMLNTSVTHLCFPWFKGSSIAVEASKEAGYTAAYWGFLPGRSENPIGMNPYCIARISARYILALPGQERRQFLKLVRGKYDS